MTPVFERLIVTVYRLFREYSPVPYQKP